MDFSDGPFEMSFQPDDNLQYAFAQISVHTHYVPVELKVVSYPNNTTDISRGSHAGVTVRYGRFNGCDNPSPFTNKCSMGDDCYGSDCVCGYVRIVFCKQPACVISLHFLFFLDARIIICNLETSPGPLLFDANPKLTQLERTLLAWSL